MDSMSNDLVDLRSDTVTRPSDAMRKAMASADVGDDVFGDDPTVNRLQAVAAERLGFAAALFCPSATQANLVSLMAGFAGCPLDESQLFQTHHHVMNCRRRNPEVALHVSFRGRAPVDFRVVIDEG
jgi:threonine aldolase